MQPYGRVLVAVDFTEQPEHLCRHAARLVAAHGAELYLVHAVEPIYVNPGYEGVPAIPLEIEEQMERSAKAALRRIGVECEVAAERQLVVRGSAANVIVNTAQEKGIDVIVVGSHARHGVGRLLGSTAAAVLQRARCDVLAVRVEGLDFEE